MILVDTSVWVDHFRKTNTKLVTLLLNDQVFMHPFIIGELACGFLKNRGETLDLLKNLPGIIVASQDEALTTIENHHLFGKGLGFIDVHLLASCQLSRSHLWTLDKTLCHQAGLLKLGF